MREIPYLRCPVCGKISLFRNFLGFHKIESFVQKIKGLGRGKGFSNKFEHTKVEGDIIEWWIRRLEEVLEWLKTRRKVSMSIKVEKASLQNSSNVSAQSVSKKETMVNPSYRFELTRTKTLNVPNSPRSMSLKVEKSTLTSQVK